MLRRCFRLLLRPTKFWQNSVWFPKVGAFRAFLLKAFELRENLIARGGNPSSGSGNARKRPAYACLAKSMQKQYSHEEATDEELRVEEAVQEVLAVIGIKTFLLGRNAHI